MKTKELIEQLLIADPIGDAEVVIDSTTDIWFVERQEWYYNGHPCLIDWDEKTYDVIGFKILAEPEPLIKNRNKVSIFLLDTEHGLLDNPDLKVFIDERINEPKRSRYKNKIERQRRRVKRVIAKIEREEQEKKEINEITEDY